MAGGKFNTVTPEGREPARVQNAIEAHPALWGLAAAWALVPRNDAMREICLGRTSLA